MLFECFEKLSCSDAFLYDIVDFTRQALADIAWDYYDYFMKAYNQADIEEFN